MVYLKQRKKSILFRVAVWIVIIMLLLVFCVSAINKRLDGIIIELARTGLKNTITKMINEAVYGSMTEGGYKDIVDIAYDSGGRVRSMTVDSMTVNLLRADVSERVSRALDGLEKFDVEVELSNVFDDEILLGDIPFNFTVDIIPVGGIETDVKSEFVSAGINQTSYRMALTVKTSITADVISAFTVDVSTSVNIVDMLIVGDVPTVCWQ